MSSGDLISLLGYYLGILAIAIAYFSSQIDAWRNRVLQLESEWSPTDQQSSTQFKLRQHGERKILRATRPIVPLCAPAVLGITLVALGYAAMRRGHTTTSTYDVELFLLAPTIILVGGYLLYGAIVIGRSTNTLDALK